MNVDYKLFTKILMQRLIRALNIVVKIQQSMFLLDRLIDDNIRIIQRLVDKYNLIERVSQE